MKTLSERERARRFPETVEGTQRHTWRRVAREFSKGSKGRPSAIWLECSACVPTHYRILGESTLSNDAKPRNGKKPGAL